MIAYITEICPDCGNLRSVCSDENVVMYPQRRMCYVSAIQALTIRRIHKRYGSDPGVEEVHPTDGMSVWMSPEDLTPDDDFLGDRPAASRAL